MKNCGSIKIVMVLICISVALPIAACARPAAMPTSTKGPINIAYITDYTGPSSGQVGMGGWAMEDYWKWLNETKGGIDGHPINIEVVDTKYDLTLILSNYKRVKDNVSSISLDSLSHGIEALNPSFEADELPNLMVTGHSPALYPPKWTFTVMPPYDDRLAMFADWITQNWKQERKPRLALFLGNFASARTPERAVWYVEQKGVEVVAHELCPWLPMDSTDQLTRLRDAKPDFVFDGLSNDMTKVVLRDRQRLGMMDIPWTCGFAHWLVVKNTVPDAALENYWFIHESYQWWETDNPGIKFVTDLYHKNRDPNIPPDEIYVLGAMSAIAWEQAIRLAVNKVGYEKLNGRAMYEYGWTQLRDFDCMGLTMPLRFSKENTNGNPYARIVKVQPGGNPPKVVADFTLCPWNLKLKAEAGKSEE